MPQSKAIALDPRYFQIIFQLIFLLYGILCLGWEADALHYIISIGGCLTFNFVFESYRQKRVLAITGNEGFRMWGLSILISALSLCLLLKTNHWYTSLLATFVTASSKYVFRYHDKHIFNPSAFGIVATLLLTGDAWLSPGQWGSNAIVFFGVATLGTIVVTRVQKLDVSVAFLLTFAGLLYWRQVYSLGWPGDHFFHSVCTGSLLLFSFFMISDPRTSPDHPLARILWAVLIASASFYLAAFEWRYNTPIWVLVFAAPLVPVLDRVFKSEAFKWTSSTINLYFLRTLKRVFIKPVIRKLAAFLLFALMISHEAAAFCGFYVSKADGTLKNKTSQVILVRDGNQNVITMYNDFQGNFKDFAMVVPVPVVLKKSDIKVVDQQIFTTLNEYSKPRLVEYYDQNPCRIEERKYMMPGPVGNAAMALESSSTSQRKMVKIEAKYIVGEYDILILSAKESGALKTWLNNNGYKLPPGADDVLQPYIKSNLKFFVVKVNEEEKRKLPGNFLRPIQISFSSPKFMLPIRLGMANADGDQDMLVYAFTKNGRVETTNYRNVSVPTNRNIPLFVQTNFSNFYSNLFNNQWSKEGKSIAMLEYAWDVSPRNFVKCDPCVATAPSVQDLVQAGVWWMNSSGSSNVSPDQYNIANVFFTRLHVRYNRNSFPQDLMFQVTPNKENFQTRYIITHAAKGDFDCDAGRKYLSELKKRRQSEMQMLTMLTGKNYRDWDVVENLEEKNIPSEASYKAAAIVATNAPLMSRELWFISLAVFGLISLVGLGKDRR